MYTFSSHKDSYISYSKTNDLNHIILLFEYVDVFDNIDRDQVFTQGYCDLIRSWLPRLLDCNCLDFLCRFSVNCTILTILTSKQNNKMLLLYCDFIKLGLSFSSNLNFALFSFVRLWLWLDIVEVKLVFCFFSVE